MASGITELDLNNSTNIRNIRYLIEQEDRELRDKAHDNSKDIMGIVRKFELVPEVWIELGAKPGFCYLGEMSARGKLGGMCDATGEQYALKGSLDKKQIQHLILVTQPIEFILSRAENALKGDKDIHSHVSSELVTTITNDKAIADWYRHIRMYVKRATKSVFKRELDLWFALMRVDNAGQLTNGILAGLRDHGMVDSQKTYCALAMAVLLCYEGWTEAPILGEAVEVEDLILSAKAGVAMMEKHSPANFAVCTNHTSKAIREARKHMDNLPREMREFSACFDRLLHYLSKVVTEEKLLSRMMVRFSLILSIVSRETIPIPDLTVDSPTRDHHDATAAMEVARAMNDFVEAETNLLVLRDDVIMESMIAEAMSDVGKGKRQKFKGMEVSQAVVEKMNRELQVAVPYLAKVDREKSMGLVRFPFVFWCWGEGPDGGQIIKAQMTRPSVWIALPASGETANPLFSKRFFGYVGKWQNKGPLICTAMSDMVGVAKDRNYFHTTAVAEGTIGSGKNHTSHFKETFSCAENLMKQRWKESKENDRMLAFQVRGVGGKLDRRRAKSAGAKETPKRQAGKNATAKGATGNDTRKRKEGVEHESGRKREGRAKRRGSGEFKSDRGNMPFGKRKAARIMRLSQQRKRMRKALREARATNRREYDFQTSSKKSMWSVLDRYATARDANFMSYGTFLSWIDRERKKRLKDHWVQLLDEFYNEFVNDDRDEDGGMEHEGHGGDGDNNQLGGPDHE